MKKSYVLHFLLVLLSGAFVSCNLIGPNPTSVAKKAIKDAEKETNEIFEFTADVEPLTLRNYPTIRKEQSLAQINTSKAIKAALNFDPEEPIGHDKYKEKKRVADSLTKIAYEYLDAYYDPKVKEAISEIEGMTMPTTFDGRYFETVDATIERDPNMKHAIRICVEATLAQKAMSRVIFFAKEGVKVVPGYGNVGAVKCYRLDDGNKYVYAPGTKVRCYIPLQSSDYEIVLLHLERSR